MSENKMANEIPENQTLYERIGGEPAITRLVNKFYDRVLADSELAPFFKNSPIEKLCCMQTEFFRTALDGPPSYTGLSIVKAHQGRGIKVRHFNLFAQHLLATLKELNIPADDIDAIIARINLQANDVTGDSVTSG
jgi:hemoglobin